MVNGVDLTLFIVGEGLRRTEVPPGASAALALAELLDLAAAGRVGTDAEGRVILRGGPAPAEPALRDALDWWEESGYEARPVAQWMARRAPGRLTDRLTRLAAGGQVVLTVEDAGWTEVVPAGGAVRRVTDRVVAAARAGDAGPFDDLALGVLAQLSGLAGRRLPGFRHRRTREALGRLAERSVPGDTAGAVILGEGTAAVRRAERRRAAVAELRRTQDKQAPYRPHTGAGSGADPGTDWAWAAMYGSDLP